MITPTSTSLEPVPGFVAVLDWRSGRELWRTDAPTGSYAHALGDRLAVKTDAGVRWFDLRSGTPHPPSPLPGSSQVMPLTDGSGLAFLTQPPPTADQTTSSEKPTIGVLDPDGSTRWQTPLAPDAASFSLLMLGVEGQMVFATRSQDWTVTMVQAATATGEPVTIPDGAAPPMPVPGTDRMVFATGDPTVRPTSPAAPHDAGDRRDQAPGERHGGLRGRPRDRDAGQLPARRRHHVDAVRGARRRPTVRGRDGRPGQRRAVRGAGEVGLWRIDLVGKKAPVLIDKVTDFGIHDAYDEETEECEPLPGQPSEDANPFGGTITADAEGVDLYYGQGNTGYIILSSQGSDEFFVYARQGNNKLVGSFTVGEGKGFDAVHGSDGLAVTNRPVGDFRQGLLVTHDEPHTGAGVDEDQDPTNFHFVDWAQIADGLGLTLNKASLKASNDPRFR